MNAVILALIAIYTVILGTVAIVVCLLIPGGWAFTPVARVWARLVLSTARVRWTARYASGIDPSRPALYMANHQSQLDIPALSAAMPAPFRFVAKRELLYVPFFGLAIWLGGFIMIKRGDRHRAIQSLNRAASTLRRGASVIVFPEGTRSMDGHLLPFKKGGFVLAISAGVPIVPVSIRGGHAILPKGSLRIRPGSMEIIFGQPLPTATYSLETKTELMQAVRDAIQRGLDGDHVGSGRGIAPGTGVSTA